MVKASNLIHMRERICADRSLRLQSRNRDKGDAGVYPKSGETVVSLRDEQERLQVVNDAESGKYLRYLDSVYMRSSQNSQPNSDTSDMNSRKER